MTDDETPRTVRLSQAENESKEDSPVEDSRDHGSDGRIFLEEAIQPY